MPANECGLASVYSMAGTGAHECRPASEPLIRVSPYSERASRSFAVTEPQANQNETQRKYKEFMELLPLTLALAGLPVSEPGRYYGEEQIETRVFAVRHAYKAAKSLVREVVTR